MRVDPRGRAAVIETHSISVPAPLTTRTRVIAARVGVARMRFPFMVCPSGCVGLTRNLTDDVFTVQHTRRCHNKNKQTTTHCEMQHVATSYRTIIIFKVVRNVRDLDLLTFRRRQGRSNVNTAIESANIAYDDISLFNISGILDISR